MSELDVGDEAAVDRRRSQRIAARFGRLDILVANAGVGGGGRIQDR